MDELPELLVETVGGDDVVETVDVGGGDFVAVTPGATHLYRSEGLLSDESIDTYGHDVDQLAVDAGRRKSTVVLASIDEESTLTVPTSVSDAVVEAILEGVLRTTGVLVDDETIEALFRFSELTLVVTDEQLLKHVGGAVWNDEFEAFRYEDLTGLDFEEGSLATQVVVEEAGRKQRVKVPNENAGRVQQEVQSAVFEFHGVSSLGGLRAAVGEPEDGSDDESDDADVGSGDPDVESDDTDVDADDRDGEASADDGDSEDGFVSADWSPPADQDITGSDAGSGTETDDAGIEASTGSSSNSESRSTTVDGDVDVEALANQVDALTEQVDYQTELLEAQEETIEQLVEELRRGR